MLEKEIVELAQAKAIAREKSTLYQDAYDAMMAELHPLRQAKKDAEEMEDACRKALDESAYAIYAETQVKELHPAVTIKEVSEVEIDDEKALIQWLLDNRHFSALKITIDKANLKKLIDLVGEDVPARIVKNPKTYVASDLNEWL